MGSGSGDRVPGERCLRFAVSSPLPSRSSDQTKDPYRQAARHALHKKMGRPEGRPVQSGFTGSSVRVGHQSSFVAPNAPTTPLYIGAAVVPKLLVMARKFPATPVGASASAAAAAARLPGPKSWKFH